jgi:hypothetical protein
METTWTNILKYTVQCTPTCISFSCHLPRIPHYTALLIRSNTPSIHGTPRLCTQGHLPDVDHRQTVPWMPNSNIQPSIICYVDAVDPVKGASNPDLNCGLSAQLAPDVAQVNPGDNVQFE